MDNHPLARRPHKSPAHTVKDQQESASAPHPLAPLNPSSKRPTEPHILQQIALLSTPGEESFPPSPLPVQPLAEHFPISEPHIMQQSNRAGKGSVKTFRPASLPFRPFRATPPASRTLCRTRERLGRGRRTFLRPAPTACAARRRPRRPGRAFCTSDPAEGRGAY